MCNPCNRSKTIRVYRNLRPNISKTKTSKAKTTKTKTLKAKTTKTKTSKTKTQIFLKESFVSFFRTSFPWREIA